VNQRPPILSIEGLILSAAVRGSTIFPVTDAHVRVGAGEIVGLIGESGSGKTLTALAVPRLLPTNVAITGGTIYVDGQDMQILGEAELVKRRGLDIGMVFQDSLSWHPHSEITIRARLGRDENGRDRGTRSRRST